MRFRAAPVLAILPLGAAAAGAAPAITGNVEAGITVQPDPPASGRSS